jgi:hypothetical protein
MRTCLWRCISTLPWPGRTPRPHNPQASGYWTIQCETSLEVEVKKVGDLHHVCAR